MSTAQKQKRTGVHTKIDIDVMAELYKLKRELGLRTYSDVIRVLLKAYKGEKNAQAQHTT